MCRFAILAYHSLDDSGSVLSLSPGMFARQMASLAAGGWRGISLGAAVEHRAHSGVWPERSVAITFDDGFSSVADAGWPTLHEHGFGATVFAVPGHVGGYNDWERPPATLGRRTLMSWDRLAELSRGGIEVGAHTMTHPDLSKLTPEKAVCEVVESQRLLEQKLGRPVTTFAYPYGRSSPAAAQAVSRTFRGACTTVLRRARTDDSHCLPRIDMYYFRATADLAPLLEGRSDLYLMVRHWGRCLKEPFRA